MKNYLLSGSVAYDSILLHEGLFQTRILPESISRLNVAFGVDSHKDEFGGTAGNIAYNASLLGQSPVLCVSVGKDFETYDNHLKKAGVDTSSITKHTDDNTAHAWILTDQQNNQITGFSKGAMKKPAAIPDEAYDCMVWHLAPEDCKNTAKLVKKAIENNKDYFLDPGQCLPGFLEGASNEILSFEDILKNAKGIFVNEYEAELLENYLNKPLQTLLGNKTEFVVRTKGSKGLDLITANDVVHIDVAKPSNIVDPTGCGDALRAGFLYGYTNGWNILNSLELGSTMGSFAIESSGGQNHTPDKITISDRLEKTFKNHGLKLSQKKKMI